MEDIAADIANASLKDMVMHFLPHHKSWIWYSKSLCMICQGWEVRYCTGYLIGRYQRLLQNLPAWDPQYNSNNYKVLG